MSKLETVVFVIGKTYRQFEHWKHQRMIPSRNYGLEDIPAYSEGFTKMSTKFEDQNTEYYFYTDHNFENHYGARCNAFFFLEGEYSHETINRAIASCRGLR